MIYWLIALFMAPVWGWIVGQEGSRRGWPFWPHTVALALGPIVVMDACIIFFFE